MPTYDPGFVSLIRSDPGFVNPIRSDPGLVSPIRSDPMRSDPDFVNGRVGCCGCGTTKELNGAG